MRKVILLLALAGLAAVSCIKPHEPDPVEVTSVSLSQSTADMLVGETVLLKASVQPSNATDNTVTWASSAQSVATVSNNGTVTAAAEGTSTITASAGGKSATCVITVSKKPVDVSSVTLDRKSITLEEGQSTALVATVIPSDATGGNVTWSSSNTSIATVDAFGVVSAVKVGTAVILASAGGKSASCVVTVAEKVVPVSSVSLDRISVTLEEGQSTVLVATVSPSHATDKTVVWSNSDASVISLEDNGKITALKEGRATVTASVGDKSASCVVTVSKSVVPVADITLDHTLLSLEKGQGTKLVATVTPADATDKTVTWSSTDATIVSVDQSGNVRALKGGKATIIAKAGEKSANCSVTVIVPVTSVSLDKGSVSLYVSQEISLVATVNPSDATDDNVTWTSSDPAVASVDNAGKVKALKKGSATITAEAGGKSATCAVAVSNVPFAVSPSSVVVPGAGGRFEVTVTCSSEYHVDSKPDWVTEGSVSGKTHTFSVGANTLSEERSGVIVFCDDEGTCLPCNVRQAAGGTFSITPISVEMDAKGGTFEVVVACSIGYHVDSKPDWIEEVTEPGMVQTHTFKVAVNQLESDRSGVIVFCDDKGTCLPCNVKQKGRVPDQATGGNENITGGDPVNW